MAIKPEDVLEENYDIARLESIEEVIDMRLRDRKYQYVDGKYILVQFMVVNQLSEVVLAKLSERYLAAGWKKVKFSNHLSEGYSDLYSYEVLLEYETKN